MESTVQNLTADNTRPYFAEEQELDYWLKKFGMSRDGLKAAVKADDSSTTGVEKQVKNIELRYNC